MISLLVGRGRLACLIVPGVLLCLIFSISAQEEPQTKEPLEWLQAVVRNLEPESSELKTKAALTFASRPLLRYSDPTRNLRDAGVWRLGTEGRPTALVTIEIYQRPDAPRTVSFEFLSLTEAKFSLKQKTRNIQWEPAKSALTLKALPGAPKPAGTPAARLAQMRQLARRFTAQELVNRESIECRMLAQPIDRYQSASEKIVDGALFAYANGTNPELGILFETDGEHWFYGALRLTSAESSVALDGRPVAAFEAFNPRGRTEGPYHNAAYRIDPDK